MKPDQCKAKHAGRADKIRCSRENGHGNDHWSHYDGEGGRKALTVWAEYQAEYDKLPEHVTSTN